MSMRIKYFFEVRARCNDAILSLESQFQGVFFIFVLLIIQNLGASFRAVTDLKNEMRNETSYTVWASKLGLGKNYESISLCHLLSTYKLNYVPGKQLSKSFSNCNISYNSISSVIYVIYVSLFLHKYNLELSVMSGITLQQFVFS